MIKIKEREEKFEKNPNKISIFATRTEAEILKDFEALGYKVVKGAIGSTLEFEFNEDTKIYIDNCFKTLWCNDITMQEHKLLNELFECYGWI